MAFWDEPKENGSPGMVPMADLNRIREPWRCQHCGTLQYLTDQNGYPAPGAPAPKFGGVDFPEICTLCFQLYAVISTSSYWRGLHDVWKLRQTDKNKLKPGEDYFAK